MGGRRPEGQIVVNIEQIAAQLYTLRAELQRPEQVAETFRRVAEIGYRAVQASGIGVDVPDERLVAAARENGLTICACHDPGPKILDTPEQVIARLKKLDCRHTAYPFPAGIDLNDEGAVRGMIEKLNRAGRLFAEAGLTLSYHNHHHEFRRLNGRLILERIYAETNPAWIKAELDTYWVQYGGGDPAAWCRKMRGRMPLIHLKDYRITEKSEIDFAEVGGGNLDMPGILRAAEESGAEWFIVEQDRCPGDPYDSLRRSFAYLRAQIG